MCERVTVDIRKIVPLAKKVLLKQEECERTSGGRDILEREALSKGLPSL